MAKIIDNLSGRRTIKMSVDDVISTVREYQRITKNNRNYEITRILLKQNEIYITEDV